MNLTMAELLTCVKHFHDGTSHESWKMHNLDVLTHVRHMTQDAGMTQPQIEPQIPDWSLGWRLRRSLEWADMSAQEMAAELDVSQGTISRWCHDIGAPPRAIYLRHWAHRCRVPYEWLTNGDDGLPRVDSNHQPAGLRSEPQPFSRAELPAWQKEIRGLVPIKRPTAEGTAL